MRPLALLATLLPIAAFAAEPPVTLANLATELRGGGYIFFVRHPDASLGNDSDGVPEWWKDCSKQRVLSELGKTQARTIGAGLARIGAPMSVKASEYCRALESVLFMGLRAVTITPALNHFNAWPREPHMDDGVREAMRGLLAAVPAPGTNTVLVGHVHNYPSPPDPVLVTMNMGDTAVFKPDGLGGFRFLLLVGPDDWAALGRP